MYQQQFNGLKSATIEHLTLQDTGTYNPVYFRPYSTNLTSQGLNQITDRVVERGGGKLNANIFSGIAGNFVAPSATPGGEVPIFNGWGERRLRFILVLNTVTNVGANVIHYIQGFTSHCGVTPTGAIDPQMFFIINSIVSVNRLQQRDPAGNLVFADYISNSSHLLTDPAAMDGRSMHVQSSFDMTPRGLFNGMHAEYLQTGMQYGGLESYVDTRRHIGATVKGSSRDNAVPSVYLGKVLDAYKVSMMSSQFSEDDSGITENAASICMEANMVENVFMALLHRNIGSVNKISNRFSYGDLKAVDPGVDQRINYLFLTNTVRANLHSAGSSEYWHGSDRNTHAANILSQGIPALMLELLISNISFRSTNMDVSGGMNTAIIDAKSLASGAMVHNFEIFKSRFEREIMFDLTFGNQEVYLLDVRADVFGETVISLGFNGEPPIRYTTATFCDSLIAPVMTTDSNLYYNTVSDFQTVTNHLSEALASSRVGFSYDKSI